MPRVENIFYFNQLIINIMDGFHNFELNIPLADKLFTLFKTTYQQLKRFPKKERYSLGESLEKGILHLLTQTFYINQLPYPLKENELFKLNAQIETLKRLFRLTREIGIWGEPEYLTVSAHTQEIGKMVGGWIRYLKSSR